MAPGIAAVCAADAGRPTPSASPGTQADPAAWEQTDVAAAGLALRFPPDWTAIDLTAEDIDRLLGEIGEANPELLGYLQSFLQAGNAIALVAFAPIRPSDPFAGNINVIRQDHPGLSPDAIRDITVAQLKGLPNLLGEIAAEAAVVDGLPAFRLVYGLSLVAPGGAAVEYCVDQYLAVSDDALWVVTFSDDKRAASLFEAIIGTVELSA
jgi:hypothetical protein